MIDIWKESKFFNIISNFFQNFRLEQFFLNNWRLFFIFLYLGYIFIFINFIIFLRISYKSFKKKKIKDDFLLLSIFRGTSSLLSGIFYTPFLGKIIT